MISDTEIITKINELFFNQSLAVAGKYYYDSLFSSSSIYGQAEYM